MKNFKILFLVLLLIGLTGVAGAASTFTEPTAACAANPTSPGCNTDEPINTSGFSQSKSGWLTLLGLNLGGLLKVNNTFAPPGQFLTTDSTGNVIWSTPSGTGGPGGGSGDTFWAGSAGGQITNTNSSGGVKINTGQLEYSRSGAYSFFTGFPGDGRSVWQLRRNDNNPTSPILQADYNGSVRVGSYGGGDPGAIFSVDGNPSLIEYKRGNSYSYFAGQNANQWQVLDNSKTALLGIDTAGNVGAKGVVTAPDFCRPGGICLSNFGSSQPSAPSPTPSSQDRTYEFGGMYTIRYQHAQPLALPLPGCVKANPFTGGCNCPSGFSSSGLGAYFFPLDNSVITAGNGPLPIGNPGLLGNSDQVEMFFCRRN